MLYLDIHATHFAALTDVRKRAAIGKNLLRRIESLETGARTLRKAVNAQWKAEYELPNYPLLLAEEAGQMMVTEGEMAYVKDYFAAAARIANDAGRAANRLESAIEGWDAVLAEATKTRDFTRKALWEAVIELDLRFSKQGGTFRAYLQDARRDANAVSWRAREKQWHAADILGGWVPASYEPPTPQPREGAK